MNWKKVFSSCFNHSLLGEGNVMKRCVNLGSNIDVISFRLELNLIPNTLKSWFVHCILKLEHKISLFPNFDLIQMALVFPKFGFNPEYFEN